jgi:hypothetical protein
VISKSKKHGQYRQGRSTAKSRLVGCGVSGCDYRCGFPLSCPVSRSAVQEQPIFLSTGKFSSSSELQARALRINRRCTTRGKPCHDHVLDLQKQEDLQEGGPCLFLAHWTKAICTAPATESRTVDVVSTCHCFRLSQKPIIDAPCCGGNVRNAVPHKEKPQLRQILSAPAIILCLFSTLPTTSTQCGVY